jgi:signal transduction histidine kinase
LAAQAAVAIQNARYHEAVRRRSEHLKALHEISKAITAESAMEQQVLDRIAEQAVESISGVIGPKATRSAILLYNETVHKLRLESVYPANASPYLTSKLDKMISLTRDTDPEGPISLVGRAFLTGKHQRTNDVRAESDYAEFNSETNSELDVPLLDGNKTIGVLSLESDQASAFDEDDTQALQSLAELVVIAIKNAERSEQLARTNAVALMGAWGADVVHDVNREAGAIRRVIYLLRQRDDLSSEVKEYLREADSYVSNLDLPELPEEIPESGRALEFKDAPLLDELVRAETQEQEATYPFITFQREQTCPGIRVAMHSLWLRRLLRHLIRNAITAIPADKETPRVIVRTSVEDSLAEIQVEDTGKGVRPEIQSTLFETPVSHKDDPEDDRPGRGLLLVRFLAEQHGGRAQLLWTQPGKGSCFAFYVPVAELAGGTSQG